MRNEASEVLQRHTSEIPVNVQAIAADLGIAVWQSRSLPENISGKLFRDPENGGASGYSIMVSAREAFYRQRFTIAHELAHFIYHHAFVGAGIADDTFYRSGLPTRLEIEANQFAADMLMPAKSIRFLLASGVGTISELAHRLQVSPAAVRIRMQQLNIFLAKAATQ